MSIRPTNEHLQSLKQALINAFDHTALARFVRERLKLDLAWVNQVEGECNITRVAADLVTYFASLEDGLTALLNTAVQENPDNRDLANLAAQWKNINFVPIPLPPEHPQLEISVGNVQDSIGVAIGPNAQTTVNINNFTGGNAQIGSNGRRPLRVFVASPGDVKEERERLGRVIEELNKGETAKRLNLSIELLRWETNVTPDLGRPQQVILDQLTKEVWDVFIGILWLRFGSSTGGIDLKTGSFFASGTEEEFHFAHQMRNNSQEKWPKIMFYRCVRSPENMLDFDIKQFQKVDDFINEFKAGGIHEGLIQHYDTLEEFEDLVRSHFDKIVWEVNDRKDS